MNREYTYRYGTIQELRSTKVVVRLEKQMLKKSCSGCSLCAADIPVVELVMPRLKNTPLAVGDLVSVGTVGLNEAEAALFAFGLPIAWALATFFILTGVFAWGGDSGKTVGLTLLAGVVGLGSVSLVDKLLRIWYPLKLSKLDAMPEDVLDADNSCSV